MKKVTVVAGASLAAVVMAVLLAAIWIRGGTQPMQWIEQPVSAPPAGGSNGQ